MANLQKQLVDVRLLGLDEKANPRTAVAGTITDGRNWQITKDGRIEKRQGIGAISMTDSTGSTISGARELTARGNELVVSDGKKWYGRNPATGEWIPRGRAAYERMRIREAMATNATCNGTESRLQMDSAAIGRTVLTQMVGIDDAGASYGHGWMLTDAQTGAVLQVTAGDTYDPTPGFRATQVGTDGHAASPTFVSFSCSGDGNIMAMVWDNTNGFKTAAQAAIVTDVDAATDDNVYGLSVVGETAHPFEVLLVGDNIWLLAYQQAGTHNIVVRRVTRSTGATFSVGSPVVAYAWTLADAATLAWAYNTGDSTAQLAAFVTNYGFSASSFVAYASVATSNASVSGTGTRALASLNAGAKPDTFRGATGFVVGGVPMFLLDAVTLTGHRCVWYWKSSQADCTRVLRGCGLLCHAFTPALGATGEIGVGIAYPSTWQASSFLMRMTFSGANVSTMTIAAHLQAGDFSGRSMPQRLQHFTPSGALALGVLNNAVSLGGNGTVSVSIATFPTDTHVALSQPVEISNTLVLPGACLKSYDGQNVTEAVFPLGPESVTATEGTTGLRWYLNADGSLTTAPPKTQGTITAALNPINHLLGSGGVDITFNSTLPGSPVTAGWPAGEVSFTIRAWLTGSGAGEIGLHGVEGHVIERISSVDGTAYRYGERDMGFPALSTTPTTYVVTAACTIPTGGGSFADTLRCTLWAGGDVGTSINIEVGGVNPSYFDSIFPLAASGVRAYRALASWTDSAGRIQRSQVCLPTAIASTKGFAVSLTVPTIAITERDPVANLNGSIQPAQIEVYRTQANSDIFYRAFTVKNSVNGDDIVFVDRSSDLDVNANEQLYLTGGGVNHWPPVGCNMAASHQGRIFVAEADDTVMFSAYAQGGEGLAFAAEYQIETEHISGDLTALLSLDDKMVVATAMSYAAVMGIGPEATGLPSYDSPMLVFSGIGPLSQRACARTPSGIVMVTAHGAHMFDRGMNLQYIGIQAEADVPDGVSWYAAAFHPAKNQVRLFGDSLCTTYDWTVPPPPNRVSQFFKWAYSVTVVATAIASGTLYYLGSDGVVYQADSGYSDNGTAYQEWIQLAVVSPVGVNAWGRVYELRFAGDVASGTTISVLLTPEEGNLSLTDTTTIAGPRTNAIAKPRYGKGSSMNVKISESAATATAGITIDAIGMIVGTKGGAGRMPAAGRMTR